MMNVSRRGFMGAAFAMGAFAGASVAVAEEAVSNAMKGKSTEVAEYAENPGMAFPWCGAGSVSGDWNGTPAEIKALGGCTMPLDELNARRAMYVDNFGEWTCADGTVIPEAIVKMRALANTYSYGVGNEIGDGVWGMITDEVSVEEAEAYLDMPRGKAFTIAEFVQVSGRSEEECKAVCESLHSKAWISGFTNDWGTYYFHVPYVQGFGEFHLPERYRGECPNFGDICSAEVATIAFAQTPYPFIQVGPVCKDVVKDGDIDPIDDLLATWATKNKFSLSPCTCRMAEFLANGTELPGYGEGDADLSAFKTETCGHDLETCLSCGEEAQFWIDHKIGREITKEEALARIQKSIEDGFVLQRTPTYNTETICSCCADHCGVLGAWQALAPVSKTFENICNYTLEVTEDTCAKCGVCADRCPLHAITMNEETGLPEVTGVCVKCGQCAYVCPTKSRWLVRKAEGAYLEPAEDIIALNNRLAAQRFEDGLIW